MKKLLLLSIAALIMSCTGQEGIKMPKFGGAKGKVESTKETTYFASEKDGVVIEEECLGVVIRSFTPEGDVAEDITRNDSTEIIKITNSYENGKLVKTKYSHNNEQVVYDRILESENKGNQLWGITLESGHQVKSEVLFDKEQNKLTTTDRDLEGNIITQSVDFYDQQGNIIEHKDLRSGQTAFWTKSEFDGNDQTKLTLLISEYSNTPVHTFKYDKLDSQQNWTVKYKYINDILASITYREIKYFE